ncbi:branched-chain amino acid ABC transporter permease [Chlorobium sp. BLA1]|uniref:branched-chain amino acid ABC transporter permease n=1 Tax=Candidatus Chlorobium masyuteum TaxID=2716876 RepID=UPI0014230BDB|nr:branched-chain amino acid ABC transporter permease [Candidatus Chlorobium masyuteum]NHQ59668.1 branched-chain amino acid ABC transporter permease [Candidatus Chlorobium masyuteum]
MLVQVFLNGLVAASIYALVALGFGLVLRVCRFYHFAHAAVFVWGAYFVFLLKVQLKLPLLFGIVIGVLLATILGCLMEIMIYRSLRRRHSSSLVVLIASLGIYVVLQNIISMAFGDGAKVIQQRSFEEGMDLFGARITHIRMLSVGLSVLLLIGVAALLKWSKVGRAMRAVGSDPTLASISGIDSESIVLFTFALASALAGVAGILVALDVDMTPTMGLQALMMGLVVVIIGGIKSIPGIAFAALILGLVQNFAAWHIGSQWQDAIAFIILLAILLVRPEGVMGKKLRKITV